MNLYWTNFSKYLVKIAGGFLLLKENSFLHFFYSPQDYYFSFYYFTRGSNHLKSLWDVLYDISSIDLYHKNKRKHKWKLINRKTVSSVICSLTELNPATLQRETSKTHNNLAKEGSTHFLHTRVTRQHTNGWLHWTKTCM